MLKIKTLRQWLMLTCTFVSFGYRETKPDPKKGPTSVIKMGKLKDLGSIQKMTQRAANAAILFNGQVIVVSGESPAQKKAHSKVEALNTSTNQWRKMFSLMTVDTVRDSWS